MSKLLALPLLLALLIACAAAPSAASAGKAGSLPVKEARQQIRVATQMWADLMDGRASISSCKRRGRAAVRCQVVIRSRRTRCDMRVSVRRDSNADTLRARGVRCRDV